MATSKWEITVPPDFDRWIKGLGKFEISQDMIHDWELLNDVFFAATQRYVHVFPRRGGSLKSSGRTSMKRDLKTRIVAQTIYGGVQGIKGPVDYAIYEIARGGDHDFITRALTDTADIFQAGLAELVVDEMKRRLG